MIASYLLRGDFDELGVGEEYAEGVIDELRAVKGVELAMTVREPPEPPTDRRADLDALVERRVRRVGDRAAARRRRAHARRRLLD